MREPTIIVPGSYFVKKSDWAIKATGVTVKGSDGIERFVPNEPAAELIAVFLFHYDNRTANRILVELIEKAIVKHKKYLRELGDWLPYSNAYMRELLLHTHGQNQIVRAIEVLAEIKFISIDVPKDIQEFYSRSHSWYKLEIETIRAWINDVWLPSLEKPQVYAPQRAEIQSEIARVTNTPPPFAEKAPEEKPAAKPENKTTETLTKQVNALCNFHRHIHGKNASYVYDAERKSRVRARIQAMRSAGIGEPATIAMCAQAIIGNVVSDFHQARHHKNMLGVANESGVKGKIFDDIGEYIFKTSNKFELMIEHAENGGVSQEIALAEFQGFVSGKPSRYAKNAKKDALKPVDAPKQPTNDFDAETIKRYKNFARELAPFFFTRVPNKEISEMCETNNALEKFGKGLTNAEFLTEQFFEAGKVFGSGIVAQAIKDAMTEFAKTFCEMQELNQ